MPSSLLLDEDGCLLPDKKLAKLLTAKDIDTTLQTILTSSRGVSACVVEMALRIMGAEKTHLFAGSWAQYVSVELL